MADSKSITGDWTAGLSRPRPPEDLISTEALMAPFARFVPAPDVVNWMRASFLDEEGPLHNPDHEHLHDAHIGVLWTNATNTRQGRRVVGQAEIPRPPTTGGKWGRARYFQQITDWFGEVPDFIVTLDALYAAEEADDAGFCALIDHECYHCAQEVDAFGAPKFRKETGLPVYALRGHDVEEFVGVVRRFGAKATGSTVTAMANAAAQKPEIGPARVDHACGTCQLRVA